MNKIKCKLCYLLFIFILSAPIFNGCFFGTFQTAETLGAGNVGSAIYITVPTYAYSDTTMEDFIENISAVGFFQIGALDNFDVGLCFGTIGIGAQGKLRLTPNISHSTRGRNRSSTRRRRRRRLYNPFDAALIGSVNYDLWHGGLVPKGDLVGSIRLGEFFSLYGGGELFYAPKLTEMEATKKYLNRELFFGINVRRGEKVSPELDWIPNSLYIEFGYPLDIEKKTFMFGIGIGGANLPVLIGSCLGAMAD